MHAPEQPLSAATPITERSGTIIGPYKLLQQIGEGGFGTVFMAEQSKPIHRRVALKVVKLGMDTKAVIARFEAERQALAMMDHPNIARVLDAAATDTGRPYFVMELVKGEPITEYADRHKLAIDTRLKLFTQVCQAVQHAHLKGVIHRDLKPSNVLVSTQDGEPFAKVIDFGIAKATSSRLTEKTLFTEFHQFIGTPQYMSPEQADGNLDVDTRSDVYSLGVLLYELLTGQTPFDAKQMRAAAYDEIARMIREVEPPKPSTRLSTMDSLPPPLAGEGWGGGLPSSQHFGGAQSPTLANLATFRATEPQKLLTKVRGELDWLVMKAMEKDRSRRYETPASLAEDVNRYLEGSPVKAVPPSKAYRTRKFVRKHRKPLLAAAALAVLLSAGLVGTGTQMIRAMNAEQAARNQGEHALQELRATATELGHSLLEDKRPRMLVTVPDATAGMPDWYTCIDWTAPEPDGSPAIYSAHVAPGSSFADKSTRRPASAIGMTNALSAAVRMSLGELKETRTELQSQKEAAELESYIANLALAQSAIDNQNWPEARARLAACPESKRGWEWSLLEARATSVLFALKDRDQVPANTGGKLTFSADGRSHVGSVRTRPDRLRNAERSGRVRTDPPYSLLIRLRIRRTHHL